MDRHEWIPQFFVGYMGTEELPLGNPDKWIDISSAADGAKEYRFHDCSSTIQSLRGRILPGDMIH